MELNPAPAQPPTGKKHSIALGQAAVILLAASWVYWPALSGEWLTKDRGLPADPGAGPVGIWLVRSGPDYNPLASMLQWIEQRLFGSDSVGFHGVDFGLHLLSALLLWGVLRKLGVRLAWLGALFFAIHPIGVDSVAWIPERGRVLFLPFFLAAFLAHLHAEDEPPRARRGTRMLSFAAFIAALLANQTAAIFPAVILLHGWWKRGRITAETWRMAEPFIAIALVAGMAMACMHGAATPASSSGAAFSGIAAIERATGGLVLECALPIALPPIRAASSPSWPPLASFAPWLALVAFLGWGWSTSRRRPLRRDWRRHLQFGLSVFLLGIAAAKAWDGRGANQRNWLPEGAAYLSLAAAAGLAAAGLGALRRSVRARKWASLLAVAYAGVLAGAGRAQAGMFSGSQIFWSSAVGRNPRSWVAQYHLGLAEASSRQFPAAVAHLSQAASLEPDIGTVQNDLAITLCLLNRETEAVPHFKASIALDPENAGVRYNYGLALRALGRPVEAREQWEEAERLTAASR